MITEYVPEFENLLNEEQLIEFSHKEDRERRAMFKASLDENSRLRKNLHETEMKLAQAEIENEAWKMTDKILSAMLLLRENGIISDDEFFEKLGG